LRTCDLTGLHKGIAMKLRCLIDRHTPFKAGRFYDVAEILEMPCHAMVRKPNGKWPRPGESYFGWHVDEFFEPSPKGIPAYTCGYRYEERDFFGTVIPHSAFPVLPKGPLLGPCSAANSRMRDLVEQCSNGHLGWYVQTDVLRGVTWPENLERQFSILEAYKPNLGRSYSYCRAERDIRAILRRLKVPISKVAPIEDQHLEFWCRSWRKAGPWAWTWREETVNPRQPKDG
jgi:hypothetical protein